LNRVLVDKTLELEFFKGALQKGEARRQKSGISGEKAASSVIFPTLRCISTGDLLRFLVRMEFWRITG
jgi:hypothetical protein